MSGFKLTPGHPSSQILIEQKLQGNASACGQQYVHKIGVRSETNGMQISHPDRCYKPRGQQSQRECFYQSTARRLIAQNKLKFTVNMAVIKRVNGAMLHKARILSRLRFKKPWGGMTF